ncbi:MAG: BTAD domain-containing putative transcriptional regulator [Actinomycetota bacterium]|nr:BTAD domain-containing putative transcriptional regulator [Actinomycetota bacterium]
MPTDGEANLDFAILGPLEVRRGGRPLAIGGPKARAILALLILEAGRVVSNARLIEGVWGEDPPNSVQAALQVHISNLRKVLGAGVVVTRAPGYLLDAAPERVDHLRFEAAVRAARAQREQGATAAARAGLEAALALWRGAPLADVTDAPFTDAAVPWLGERRSRVADELIELSIDLGDHRQVIADLEATLATTPHREGVWAQLMLALYRSGRQADALTAFQRARNTLLDDLGIEPGGELRRLETAILSHDPSLDASHPAAAKAAPTHAVSPVPVTTVKAVSVRNGRLVSSDGTEHALTDAITLGRNPDCTIVLTDLLVSRRHAEIRPALGGHLLVDLGSSNGTLVNGLPTTQHLLQPGDLVTIGTHELRYLSD